MAKKELTAKEKEAAAKVAAEKKAKADKKAKEAKAKKYPDVQNVLDGEGRKRKGFVSEDGKSVTDLAGATFAM